MYLGYRMKNICVDLDGTIAKYDKFNGPFLIGDPYDGAREFLQSLKDLDFKIIIFTCRNSPEYVDNVFKSTRIIKERLNRHGLLFDSIWIESGKPIADWYVDDKGIRCEPEKGYERILETIKD